MQRAIPLRRALEDSPETAFLLSGDGLVRNSDVVASAGSLAGQLRALQTQRLMLRSADPALILAAFLACWEEGIDLIVAHFSLEELLRAQIAVTLQADTRLDSTAGGGFQVGAVRAPAVRAQGSVILMTSGTTDLPKLAEHQPAALVSRILASASVGANRGGRKVRRGMTPRTALGPRRPTAVPSASGVPHGVPRRRDRGQQGLADNGHGRTGLMGTPDSSHPRGRLSRMRPTPILRVVQGSFADGLPKQRDADESSQVLAGRR